MEEKLIQIGKRFFFVKEEKLFDAETHLEETELHYLYVRNYSDENICYIITQNRFFQWDYIQGEAQEYPVEILCQNKLFTYFYTTEGVRFVFATNAFGKIFIIGRNFQHIYENLYKIGKYAYQIVDGELEKICECMEFEKIDVFVEISAGESGISETLSLKKEGKKWRKVNHWLPGNIIPRKFRNTLKK